MASAVRENRYNSRGAVYGDLAYDLDREVREHALRHAGEPPRRREERPEEKPRVRRLSRPQLRERQRISPVSVLGFVVVGVLTVTLLYSYIRLSEISNETVQLQRQLDELESEHVRLTAQYEEMFDLDAVQAAAEAAGMSKPGSSQIFYVDLSDGDSAVVYQQEEPGVLSRLLSSLNHGVYAVMEYFD